jgi:hypothetical protein
MLSAGPLPSAKSRGRSSNVPRMALGLFAYRDLPSGMKLPVDVDAHLRRYYIEPIKSKVASGILGLGLPPTRGTGEVM